MAEDYRLSVRLQAESHAEQLLSALHAHEVEEDVRRRYGDRIAVSGSGDHVFLYADSEDAARDAQAIVQELLGAQGLGGEFKLDRWHHAEEEWEDVSVPLPSTPEQVQIEHAKLEQQEAAESRASGVAEWELRIELASHHDARALAERLAGEGFSQVVRRWKFLIIGTADEDDAHSLAQRLKTEVPTGATIHVEPGGGIAWESMPRSPFAVFGGLAS